MLLFTEAGTGQLGNMGILQNTGGWGQGCIGKGGGGGLYDIPSGCIGGGGAV